MSVTSILNCSGFALPAGIDPKNSHCTQVISVLQLQVLITTLKFSFIMNGCLHMFSFGLTKLSGKLLY